MVPLRYYHQSAMPHWHFAAIAAKDARDRISGDCDSDREYFLKLVTRHISLVTVFKELLIRFSDIYIQEVSNSNLV